MMTRVLLALLACSTALHAEIIRVGPAEPIARIADAARVAKDGDTVLVMPGEYQGDVAVWPQKRLTIRGAGLRPVVVAAGSSAEDKAIWVVRNGEFLIENIEFRGARVADGNGAGIRFEGGRLEVDGCAFIDNQNGILTSNSTDAELVVRNSLFAHAPRPGHQLPHLIYVGRIARFELTGSRLHDGYEGHLVKSRARVNEIRYNLIHDGPGGEASYELEFPDGGMARVIGNVIGQSEGSQNPVLIAYGAEGPHWPENALFLAHNTLHSALAGAWFLRVWDDKFGGSVEVKAINNLSVGLGLFTLGAAGEFAGNYPALESMLGGPDILDFTLADDSILRGLAVAPEEAGTPGLVPDAEFNLPIGTRPLERRAEWTPGAFQSRHYSR